MALKNMSKVGIFLLWNMSVKNSPDETLKRCFSFYPLGGYNDGYASQRSSFGPVRGGKRSSGGGGGGPYGGKML